MVPHRSFQSALRSWGRLHVLRHLPSDRLLSHMWLCTCRVLRLVLRRSPKGGCVCIGREGVQVRGTGQMASHTLAHTPFVGPILPISPSPLPPLHLHLWSCFSSSSLCLPEQQEETQCFRQGPCRAGGREESKNPTPRAESLGSLSHVAEPHPAPAMTVRRRVWLCA